MDGSAVGRLQSDAEQPLDATVNRPRTGPRRRQPFHAIVKAWDAGCKVHASASRPRCGSSRTLRGPHALRCQSRARAGLLGRGVPSGQTTRGQRASGGRPRRGGEQDGAQELLRGVLAGLLVHKTAADFPLKCVLARWRPCWTGPTTRTTRSCYGQGRRNLGLILLLVL
jgi:hypothetical protein